MYHFVWTYIYIYIYRYIDIYIYIYFFYIVFVSEILSLGVIDLKLKCQGKIRSLKLVNKHSDKGVQV